MPSRALAELFFHFWIKIANCEHAHSESPPGGKPTRRAFIACIRLLIPQRYRYGMTTQIAVRLPDEMVEFLDQLVAQGEAKSRAAVMRALELDRRRRMAEHDAAIYAGSKDRD